jgi:hypothetical protein
MWPGSTTTTQNGIGRVHHFAAKTAPIDQATSNLWLARSRLPRASDPAAPALLPPSGDGPISAGVTPEG